MKQPTRIILALSLLAGAAGTARAQTPASSEPAEALVAPFKMPDLSSRSAFRFDLGVARISADDGDETITSAVGAASANLAVAPGIVVTARIPFTHASSSEEGDDLSESDLGNIGVGARLTRRSGDVHFGGGVMLHLPTAPEFQLFGDDDDGAGAFVATLTQFDSYADFFPDATIVRIGGDVRVDRGNAFFQGQLGVERLDSDNADESFEFVRVGAAAGIQATPQLALVGEVTFISTALEDEVLFEDGEGDLFYWLDVGARYQVDGAVLGGRLYVPLDAPLQDVDTIGVGFDVSVPL